MSALCQSPLTLLQATKPCTSLNYSPEFARCYVHCEHIPVSGPLPYRPNEFEMRRVAEINGHDPAEFQSNEKASLPPERWLGAQHQCCRCGGVFCWDYDVLK